MTKKTTIASLGTLVQLRSTQVERLQAELAAQEATRVRYQNNLDRLATLTHSSGASGAASGNERGLAPALALNCGAYKQDVMALADIHRLDLQLHEANMAVAQRRVHDAWTRRELLGMVLERARDTQAQAQERSTRKREDDIATQSWMAGRAA
jgi:flagellar export protein FliJ